MNETQTTVAFPDDSLLNWDITPAQLELDERRAQALARVSSPRRAQQLVFHENAIALRRLLLSPEE